MQEKSYQELFSMEGKVVIITGGSGYLGSALTDGFLAQGAQVIVADLAHTEERLSTGREQAGDSLRFVACDIAQTDSIRAMLKESAAIWGRIDVLVNCATYGALNPIEKMTDEEWNRGLDGAVGTAFRCTREVIPYFTDQGGGVIVNFASMYGVVSPDPRIYGKSGQNNPVNYGAGKAAVIQLTRYCAAHLADRNIRVNCVTPGPFPSDVKRPPQEFLDELNKKTMLGRVGKPREIVGAVIYLASDASSFTTGANIVVDGGWTAW